jgi:uncharacterized membrane protein HdeD (DUF308 family)
MDDMHREAGTTRHDGRDEGDAPRHDSHDDGEAPRHDDDRVVVQEEVALSRREAHLLDHQAGWAAHNWGWLLAVGLIAIVFGIVVLSHAFGSLGTLVWLTGLFLLFMGVAQLVTMGRGGARSAHLAGALVAVVGGVVLLAWPGETLKVVAVVAGITFLAWGIVRAATAYGGPHETRTNDVAAGVALIILGVIMMAWPGATITLVGVFVGLIAIVWGAVMVAGAFNLRKSGRRWQELRAKSRVAR